MQVVVDFLLEYYVWILVVLIILLITVVGFLVDTKKKKKMRDSANTVNESSNTMNPGMMDMNNMGDINNINSMNNMGNINNGFNTPVGDVNNNMFNNNMMGNEMAIDTNNAYTEQNGGAFFNPNNGVSNVEPKVVEPTPIMNNNMVMPNGNMPEVNIMGGTPNQMMSNVMPSTPVVEAPVNNVNSIPAMNNNIPNNMVVNSVPVHNVVPEVTPVVNEPTPSVVNNPIPVAEPVINNMTPPVVNNMPPVEPVIPVMPSVSPVVEAPAPTEATPVVNPGISFGNTVVDTNNMSTNNSVPPIVNTPVSNMVNQAPVINNPVPNVNVGTPVNNVNPTPVEMPNVIPTVPVNNGPVVNNQNSQSEPSIFNTISQNTNTNNDNWKL